MKNILYTLLFLLMVSFSPAHGQRMLHGQKGVEFGSGMLSGKWPQDHFLNLGLIIYKNNGNYRVWALEYSHRSISYKNSSFPIKTYVIESGYSFQLLSDLRKDFVFNAGIAASAGMEIINQGEQRLYDGAKLVNDGGFIYGISGSLSLEAFLSDRFALLFRGNIKLLWGAPHKQFRPAAGLGLRVNL